MAAPQKDWWDKLDVIGKLSSGVLLAVLALVVKHASDTIAVSMQSGELVHKLIGDLTTREQQARQDLALIALDHAVGDRNPLMVSAIAERIFHDTQSRDTAASQALGGVAFAVLEQRSPLRAQSIRDSLEAFVTRSRTQLVSNPDPTIQAVRHPPAQAKLITRAFRSVVYIQYKQAEAAGLAEELRRTLQAAGIFAPGADHVDGAYRNWIRYFHPEDRALAEQVAGLAEDLFARERLALALPVEDFSGRGFDAPPGQVELWIDLEATGTYP